LIKAEFYNWSIPEKQYNALRDRCKVKVAHPPSIGHEQESRVFFTDFPGFPELRIVKENLDCTGWMQIIDGGK